jgi:monoamine oxidase
LRRVAPLAGQHAATTGRRPFTQRPLRQRSGCGHPERCRAPDNYFEFNWSIAEWARGDFASGPRPGVWTGVGFGPALRAPVDRIRWAGVDLATDPNASMSGAIQSGKRAAQEVLPLM